MTPVLPAPRAEWAYFFDIDGTLAEIVGRPELARVAPDLIERVAALAHATGGAVALVSGRPLREIDALFRGLHMPAAGQHGAERRGASGHVTSLPVAPEQLGGARTALARVAARHPGLLLEDKGFSLALHYRAAPRLASYAHRVMRVEQRRLGSAYTVQAGKRVVELVRANTDKGAAIRAFMLEEPFRGRTPVFVGDDVTDEHAFEAVNALGGHSVKVGPGRSAARWRLPDVDAVGAWLARADR